MHSRQRFTGQERDGVAGLDDVNARSLQMRTGRMNRPDRLFGNAPVNAQRWNRYAYVMSNPLRFTDPSGLEAESVFRATVIGYTCALTNCVSVNAGLHVRPDIQSSVFDTHFYLNFAFESGDGGFGVGADEGGGGGGQPPPPSADKKKPPASGATRGEILRAQLTGFFDGMLGTLKLLDSGDPRPSCFWGTVENTLINLLPISPSVASLAEPISNAVQLDAANDALEYAASRQLIYPQKSSVFRRIFGYGTTAGRAAWPAAVVLAEYQALFGEFAAASRGQCR